MNHIKVLDDLSSNKFVEESISTHDKYPALFSGEMDIQDTDCEEFIRDKVEMIFLKSRERWSGLESMSFCYGIDSANRKLKYTVGVSSENLTFSIYVLDFIKRFLPKLDNSEEMRVESDEDTIEEEGSCFPATFKLNPALSSTQGAGKSETSIRNCNMKSQELVQINATSDMVKSWINSFVRSRREIINAQNIKEFCLPPDKRQNCARVDAVLVKRKDTSSHIRVEHVSNLWGPQMRNEISPAKNRIPADEHSYSITKRTYESSQTGLEPNKKKKVYSGQDVANKLEEIKLKYLS